MKLKLKYGYCLIKYHNYSTMNRQNRREQKKLIEVGTILMTDASMPVHQRVKTLRTFMREFRQESEKLKMDQFKQVNGFAADDDHAKRALVDQLVFGHLKRYPKDDDERNEYIHTRNPMMEIGWRPSA
jgi:hypothetical protein